MRSLTLSTGICLTLTCSMFIALPLAVAAYVVPPNDGYVTDLAGILTPADVGSLKADLAAYREQTSNQIAVLIVPSLDGEALEDASLAVARKWGIGDKTKKNGILLLISYQDHAARIEVGYGLEGAVPDIVAKGIIDTDIAPAFRAGQYGAGIAAAIESLKKHIGGEYSADRYVREQPGIEVGVYGFVIFLIALQWMLAVLGRTKSWWLGGVFGGVGGLGLAFIYGLWLSIPVFVLIGLVLDYLVSRNYSRRGKNSWWVGGGWGPGGGFGGGSSGGGFGGFGGGGFGGGGASGRW